MRLHTLDAHALDIPFKAAFAHASATRTATQSIWVRAVAEDGSVGYGEGCPREYVTAESVAGARAFCARHNRDWHDTVRSLPSLIDWTERHEADIDANPAAWTAAELALLDLLGKERGDSLEALFGLPELAGRFRYTAVLGDAAPKQFGAQLAHYREAGFAQFKIKLSGELERDLAKVRALAASGVAPEAVRADANNLWNDADAAIRFVTALRFPMAALEEPLRPGDVEGMRCVASQLETRIILDESILRAEQLAPLAGDPDLWIVNVRVSKMGGLARSLAFVGEARRRGFKVIVGAHVGETSVLTRAALTVAHSGRDLLLAQEGAFGTHLLERDVVEPPVMFGRAGILDVAAQGFIGRPGLGLAMHDPIPAI